MKMSSKIKQQAQQVSIKRVTMLGFMLVVIPLALVLLYSVTQVHQLAKQGAGAIYDVAQVNDANYQLGLNLTQLERLASQYVVLKDPTLLQSYQALEEEQLLEYFHVFERAQAQSLVVASNALQRRISITSNKLSSMRVATLDLPFVEQEFAEIASLYKHLSQATSVFISQHASGMEKTANQVSGALIRSLLIIPFSLVIAGIFIVVITKPVKILLQHIADFEKGNFKQALAVNGAFEIKQIGDALEQMRQQLNILEMQKSSFIRHISHELKTPLAAIREGTELIHDNSLGELNSGQKEVVDIIRNSVDRLQQLIEDLLDFNLVLNATNLPADEHIYLKPLIEEVIKGRQLDIQRKKLKLNVQLDDSLLINNAYILPSKPLSVMLDNLLSNAIKFSPTAGEITIAANLVNKELCLQVSDQGKGIPALEQNKIYDAFFQGSQNHDHQIKGSGLGLAIVKELVARLQGRIELLATPSSTGCCFSVYIPINGIRH